MRNSSLAIIALAALTVAPAAQAGFIGNTMSVGYYVPDTSTLYGDATYSVNPFVVGAGVETVVDVEQVTQIAVDFTDQTLTLDFTSVLTDPTWLSRPFNGLIFNLVSPGSLGIAGVAVDPSTTYGGGSFNSSGITFNDTQLAISWPGLSYQDGQKLVLNFSFAPVPEPSAVVLTGTGLAGLLGLTAARRRLAGR